MADPKSRKIAASVSRQWLPSLPLALAILGQIRLHENQVQLCKRAGISDRTLREWIGHEQRNSVKFDLADKVLCRLGLCWWDVWNEETTLDPEALRAAEFAFTGEHPEGEQLEMAA